MATSTWVPSTNTSTHVSSTSTSTSVPSTSTSTLYYNPAPQQLYFHLMQYASRTCSFKRQKFYVQCTTTATTVLLPLYTSTCVSRHLQLRTGRFCTPWVKKTRHQTLGHNYPIFKIFFTSRLSSKFATNSCLNIPPCFKHVATLPCEIWIVTGWAGADL